ncbi:hypothetical protein Tco_1578212 [Tanacetum coccineum]
MEVFPLSLTMTARPMVDSEGEGKITVWEELVEKFFCKFYPDSYDGEEEMLDGGDNWGIDLLEFILRVNSSFDKHMKIDGRTKKVLFHAWMNGMHTKKKMDQSQIKRKYAIVSEFIDEQPNKRMCKAEKFEAIQYSLGPNEEYIAIRRCEYDIWERNEDNMSKIYQDIFQKKDNGWKQKARILELKRRYFKDYYSDNQYAVSIKEDTAYPCLHSPKTTKETSPIRRIQERQYAVFKLYGNKIFWKISNVVPTPRNSNTPYPIPWIRREAHDVYYALKYDWKDLLHQTKSVKHIGKSKEVGTLRYLSLVVPLTKVGDEAVHKELGDRMERAATTASSLEAEQDSGSGPRKRDCEIQIGDGNACWNSIGVYTARHKLNTASIKFGQEKTITEASLRRHLKLEDNGGVTTLPNSKIFEQLALMGYATDSDKLTFQKGKEVRADCEDKPIWKKDKSEIQEKISDDTKGEQEVTTADTTLNTPSVPISTASATPEKSKKQLEQERLSHEEAIRLQEQVDEDERKRIARDAEISKQLQEEYDKAGKKEVVAEVDTVHVIDWNDSSVIRYHALQNRPRSIVEVRKNMLMYLKNQGGYKMKDFKGMSYDDIRSIFEKVWDQVHSFVSMDSEEEVQRLKRAGQDVEAKPAKRQRTEEVSESVQEQTDEELKTDELSQEQLNQMVIIVPDEGINVEALQTKYLIIGWEVYSKDTMQFWKIIRVGNHTEIYQVFEDMLKNFDRDDPVKLWSLVLEIYNSSGLTKDKEIELWVELKMLFEPDAENLLELQKYMHDPLKWWLYDMCAVHHVSTDKG